MFTPKNSFFSFGDFYVCANFGENPSRNASVRVHADGHTDRGNWFYNLTHAICYSYGTDKSKVARFMDHGVYKQRVRQTVTDVHYSVFRWQVSVAMVFASCRRGRQKLMTLRAVMLMLLYSCCG